MKDGQKKQEKKEKRKDQLAHLKASGKEGRGGGRGTV